jgi:hypothetical protein
LKPYKLKNFTNYAVRLLKFAGVPLLPSLPDTAGFVPNSAFRLPPTVPDAAGL